MAERGICQLWEDWFSSVVFGPLFWFPSRLFPDRDHWIGARGSPRRDECGDDGCRRENERAREVRRRVRRADAIDERRQRPRGDEGGDDADRAAGERERQRLAEHHREERTLFGA